MSFIWRWFRTGSNDNTESPVSWASCKWPTKKHLPPPALSPVGIAAYMYQPLTYSVHDVHVHCPLHAESLQQTFGSIIHSVVATVTISPTATDATTPEVTFDPTVHVAGNSVVEAVKSAVESACFQGQCEQQVDKEVDSTPFHAPPGPLLGFPVLGMAVKVEDLCFAEGAPLPLLSGCVAQCISKAGWEGLNW